MWAAARGEKDNRVLQRGRALEHAPKKLLVAAGARSAGAGRGHLGQLIQE
jgi:hypothetical protein